MNKLSPRHIVVAAALFGITANSAWSQEATPGEAAAPAGQTAPTTSAYVPGYAPTPNWGGYEYYWQPAPWPEPPPPPGYFGHYPPYYPPYPHYRAAQAAPAENPLKAELKQTQDQLAAKDAELNTANEQLGSLQTEQQTTREALQEARAQLAAKITELDTAMEKLTGLQAEQQAIREVMQQAQDETAKASEQLSVVVEEMDILYEVLSQLKDRLDMQNISLQGAVEAGAEANGPGDSAVEGKSEAVPPPAAPPVQPGDAGGAQTESGNRQQAEPEVGEQI